MSVPNDPCSPSQKWPEPYYAQHERNQIRPIGRAEQNIEYHKGVYSYKNPAQYAKKKESQTIGKIRQKEPPSFLDSPKFRGFKYLKSQNKGRNISYRQNEENPNKQQRFNSENLRDGTLKFVHADN
ncbi:hypothetical protein FACS1894187_14230 [Synergistales bacterium]|nr:hypothetical protein FACS1894187_14230 [Synergistales bacterium]